MKTYVLIISGKFPAIHKRAGDPTMFAKQIKSGDKKHTIRFNYKHWRPIVMKVQEGIAKIEIREWTGRPYNSKQKTVHTLTKDSGLDIIPISMSYKKRGEPMSMSINDRNNPNTPLITFNNVDDIDLPKNDGFPNKQYFYDWFKPMPNPWHGCIIYFSEFRYNLDI